jgi:serine/threonine protein kinase
VAESLIERLLKMDSSERYSASQALQHPWVTRDLKGEVPLTVHEILITLEQT